MKHPPYICEHEGLLCAGVQQVSAAWQPGVIVNTPYTFASARVGAGGCRIHPPCICEHGQGSSYIPPTCLRARGWGLGVVGVVVGIVIYTLHTFASTARGHHIFPP